MLTANMKMIAECADKLAHLGEKLFNETEMKKINIGQFAEFSCPEGYEFHDENGNIINAQKIVLEKKKPKYPKNFRECKQVLDSCSDEDANWYGIQGYRFDLLEKLQYLLVCRDAYWYVYAKEQNMPFNWKPEWSSSDQEKFTIRMYDGYRHFGHDKHLHSVLAFPTAEMRDAFYENFKDLIEECKELL